MLGKQLFVEKSLQNRELEQELVGVAGNTSMAATSRGTGDCAESVVDVRKAGVRIGV